VLTTETGRVTGRLRLREIDDDEGRRVRDVIRNFNADGFASLYPKYRGGRPPKFTLAQRREVKKIVMARPGEYDLPFSTWSLAKPADFLVAEGGGRRHQPRRAPGPAPRRGRHLSAAENMEGIQTTNGSAASSTGQT
jgi:hypothetical protein